MVDRLIKAKPTVGDMPRDSLMAHMISCWSMPPTLLAAVLGLPVLGRPRLRCSVGGLGVDGYVVDADVDADVYEVDVLLGAIISSLQISLDH